MKEQEAHESKITRWDWAGAALFLGSTIAFILLMIFNSNFFNWAWGRHHNMLSWYIRTLALVPFMFFAYKRSLTGMMFSIFFLATSMAWFPKPDVIDPGANDFLAMEYDYLTSAWTTGKILLALAIPLMFILLGMAFWKRNFLYGGFVVVGASLIKIIWSFIEGGQSGWALVPAAIFSTVLTVALIYLYARMKKKSA